jgi:hypothetical protein
MFDNKKEWYYILEQADRWIKFDTFEDLLDHVCMCRSIRSSCPYAYNYDSYYIGRHLQDAVEVYLPSMGRFKRSVSAVVYDADSCIVDPEYVEYRLSNHKPKHYFSKKYFHRYELYHKQRESVKYRVDPLIHMGKKWRRGRSAYRTPMTAQERRKSLACNKKFIRAKRNFKNLPNSYDDICYSRNGRTWKNSKKLKQWM